MDLTDEQIKFQENSIKMSIQNTDHDDDQVDFDNGILYFTTKRILFQINNKNMNILYQNAATCGTNKLQLNLFLHGNDQNLIQSLQNTEQIDYNLQGNYLVIFDFSNKSIYANLSQIFEIFSQCSALNTPEIEYESDEDSDDNEWIGGEGFDKLVNDIQPYDIDNSMDIE